MTARKARKEMTARRARKDRRDRREILGSWPSSGLINKS
jgi:hypothetical protein